MPSSLIIGALGLEAGGFAAGLVTLGVRLAETYAISSLINKNLDQPVQNQNTGGLVQLPPATNNKLPVVYGIQHVAPVIVDAMLSTDQQTMWFVLALSEATSGDVTIGDVYWDDKLLVFDPSNPSEITSWYVPKTASGAEADSRVTGVAGKISMWFYGRGSSNEITHQCTTFDSNGNAIFSQNKSNVTAFDILKNIPSTVKWTDSNKMSDTVFAVCKVVYDQNHGVTSLSQNIKFELRNTLSSPGQVIKDYLENNRYGCNVLEENINLDSLTALDTFSNQVHQLKLTDGTYQSGIRYAINGRLDTAQDCMVNLNQLADSCDSWIQWDERTAKWGVVMNRSIEEAGGSTSTMMVITADNIIGGINILPTDLKTSANKLSITYPSYTLINQADNRYYELPPQFKNQNEPDNNLSVTYPFVDNDLQATYLGYKKLWSTRADLVINFSMDYSGIRIDAGDVIAINHEWYRWGIGVYNDQIFPGKPFRVTQVKEHKDASGFLSVQIAAVEYNASVYVTTDPGFFELTEFNYSLLGDPNYIPKPAKPTISNITTGTTINFFRVNSVVPNQGRVEGIEYWYGKDNTFSQNNFALYETQYYSTSTTTSLYPQGASEYINVTGIPEGTYYWAVKAIGPQASSEFSDLSDPVVWTPEMAGGLVNGGSIADNSISGSKVISGDPATVGSSQSNGFFDTMGPVLGAGLGLLAINYGYKNGIFDGILPDFLKNKPKGGEDPGQTPVDPTTTITYTDGYGNTWQEPAVGRTMNVVMDATPPQPSPEETIVNEGLTNGDQGAFSSSNIIET